MSLAVKGNILTARRSLKILKCYVIASMLFPGLCGACGCAGGRPGHLTGGTGIAVTEDEDLERLYQLEAMSGLASMAFRPSKPPPRAAAAEPAPPPPVELPPIPWAAAGFAAGFSIGALIGRWFRAKRI